MGLQISKLVIYMNISFFSLVAGWMPVINLRKRAGSVRRCAYFCDMVCYLLLYHFTKESFLVFMHGRTEFVNQMSKAMFSVLKRRDC